MSSNSSSPSILKILPPNTPSFCGYCHKSSSLSYGITSSHLLPHDYQETLNRGFRRSGNYVYRYENEKTCCPAYTIRLEVERFRMSANQRSVENRWKRYVSGEEINKKMEEEKEEKEETESEDNNEAEVESISRNLNIKTEQLKLLSDLLSEILIKLSYSHVDNILHAFKKYKNLLSTSIAYKIDNKNIKSVSDNICNQFRNNNITCEVNNGFITFNDIKCDFMHPKKVNLLTKKNEFKPREYTCTLEPASFNAEAYEIYKKYQVVVHKDPPNKFKQSSYANFLCNSPLVQDGIYGSFHQHYRIDGKLVAVGVIDILPYCLSSVYFFYDPDYEFLSLGKVSALQEIQFVQKLSRRYPKLKYYYLGYYIHNCPKMKYKGSYSPSELLCDQDLTTWYDLSKCQELLDKTPYVIFSKEFNNAENKKEEKFENAVKNIKFKVSDTITVTYNQLPKKLIPQIKDILKDYVRFLGSELISRIIVEM